MIIDSTAVEIVRESQLGQYDTIRAVATYSCRQQDGGTFLRFADGTTYTAKPGTEILEKKRFRPVDYEKIMQETYAEIERSKSCRK